MTSRLNDNPLALNAVSTGHRDRFDDVALAVVGCGLHSMTSILPSVRYAAMRLVAVCDLDLCNDYKHTVFDFDRYRRPEMYKRITAQRGSEEPTST